MDVNWVRRDESNVHDLPTFSESGNTETAALLVRWCCVSIGGGSVVFQCRLLLDEEAVRSQSGDGDCREFVFGRQTFISGIAGNLWLAGRHSQQPVLTYACSADALHFIGKRCPYRGVNVQRALREGDARILIQVC